MKHLMQNFAALAVTITLVGCSGQVGKSIQQAVEDNQNAASLLEWENSSAHPRLLFEKWRSASADKKTEKIAVDLCKELSDLDGQSLTVFENEINDKANGDLLMACKVRLLLRLEDYYVQEKAKTPPITKNFKFRDNVQKRNTTNGYYAVSGDVARKEVVLTFDDGPSSAYTRSILRSLRDVNAKAIFFPLGKVARANPEILKSIAEDGHSIGAHTNSHTCIGTSSACRNMNGRVLSFNEATGEIRSGHQAVYDILGWVDPFFRFPYGEASADLKNFLRTNATAEFFWAVDSEDWRAQTNENLLRNTISRIEGRGRGIVLFHDIQRRTAEIMPTFLQELYTRGYDVVLLQSEDPTARYNNKLVKKRVP